MALRTHSVGRICAPQLQSLVHIRGTLSFLCARLATIFQESTHRSHRQYLSHSEWVYGAHAIGWRLPLRCASAASDHAGAVGDVSNRGWRVREEGRGIAGRYARDACRHLVCQWSLGGGAVRSTRFGGSYVARVSLAARLNPTTERLCQL